MYNKPSEDNQQKDSTLAINAANFVLFIVGNVLIPGILGALVAIIMIGVLPDVMLAFTSGYSLEYSVDKAVGKVLKSFQAIWNGEFKSGSLNIPIIGFVIMTLLYNLYRDKREV